MSTAPPPPRSDSCTALSWLLITLGACGFACPVLAQESSSEQDTSESSDDDAATLDRITVTGSRIRRAAGFDGPAPAMVLTSDIIRSAGHTQISDIVNQLPSFALTQTGQTSNLVGNPGINALDLRGMGTQRTLTLVDGRRQVPSIPGTSSVDLSMLPASLVERMEVVTGGTSAMYGADAVTGVANFILKKDFDGLEASTQLWNSTRGDMPTYTGHVLFGKNFAGHRGNVTAYGFWEKTTGGVSGQGRPWTAKGYPLYGRMSPDEKYSIRDGNRNFYNSPDAHVSLGNCEPNNPLPCLYAFTPDGRLRRPELGPGGLVNFTPPANILQQGLTDGGEYGGRYDSWYLMIPSDRQALRTSLGFDFNDAARLFTNLTWSRSQSKGSGRSLNAFGSGGDESVPGDSPFITQEMIEANGGPITRVEFGRHFDNELGRMATEYHRDLFQATLGLEGDFAFLSRDWYYSGHYSHGRTRQRIRSINAASTTRFYLGLDSTTGTDGNPVCRSLTPGCVPINPFRRLSAEEAAWLLYTTDWAKTEMTQKVASLYASGGVFDLPGGEAQVVLGAEYRKERNDIGVIPEFNPEHPNFDPTLGTISTPLVGEYSVKEVFGELSLPLLADLPGARRLALDIAGRVSEYSTAGRTTTRKFGLEWAPLDDLTLRGTYGKAVRAPNIGELYTAGSISSAWINDPCNEWNLQNRADRTEFTATNCASINPSISDVANYWMWREIVYSGNLDLKPETAKTLTYGFVVRPRVARNFSMSVDYYRIDLRGVISVMGFQEIINRCVDLPSLNNPFCDLVSRDGDGNLQQVAVQQLNLAQSFVRGVDINASWQHDFAPKHGARAGAMSLALTYGRLLTRNDIADQDADAEPWRYVGLFGAPAWKGVVRTGWYNSSVSVYWTLRHFSKMRSGPTITEENYLRPYAGNIFYSDFYANYAFTPKLSVYGGLSNAFDRAPPRIPGAEAGGANFNQAGYQAGLYDVIGRTFYLGIRVGL